MAYLPILAIALLGQVLLTFATVRYDGHQVFRIIPQNIQQLDYLRQLIEQNPDVDVWLEPTLVGAAVEMMAPPRHTAALGRMLATSGLPYDIIMEDLQQSFHEHQFMNELARHMWSADWWKSYHEYQEIMDWVDQKAVDCGRRCEVFSIGKSTEGRDLKVIKISSGGANKESMWIDGGIHAREWISPATAQYFIERLVDDYDSDPVVRSLVDTYDWYIQPSVNPDGYVHTWTHDRNWRKTRSRSNDTICVGVDCNRNYDYMWMTIGASSDPCSNTFAGFHALSEPEAKAQSDFIMGNKQLNWKMFITLHSYGQLWMAPYGYTKDKPKDYDLLMRAGSVAVTALESVYGTPYTLGSASEILYQSSGTSRDWAYGKAGFQYVYTIELRDKGDAAFLLPPDQILPTAEETWAGLRKMADYIMQIS